MRCGKARKYIMSFHDGELPETRKVKVGEHLSSCGDCKSLFERLQVADRAVRVPDPGQEYWNSFTGRIMQRVRAEESAGRRKSTETIMHQWRPLWKLAPAFSAVFVAVVAAGILLDVGKPPRPMKDTTPLEKTVGETVPVTEQEEGIPSEKVSRFFTDADDMEFKEHKRADRDRPASLERQKASELAIGSGVAVDALSGREMETTADVVIPPSQMKAPEFSELAPEQMKAEMEPGDLQREGPEGVYESNVVAPAKVFEARAKRRYDVPSFSQVAVLDGNIPVSHELTGNLREYLDSRFAGEDYKILYNEDLNRDGINEVVAVLPANGGRAADIISDPEEQRAFSGMVAFREGVVVQEVSGRIVEQVIVMDDRVEDATGLVVTWADNAGWTIRPMGGPDRRGLTLNSITVSGDVSEDQEVIWDDSRANYNLLQEVPAAPAVKTR